MAEKKYVAVNPEDGISNEMVRMLNPNNEFKGLLMSYSQYDKSDVLDVRELFLAHVKVDGKFIQAYTDNARRVVDISPHVELNIVSIDGEDPDFTEWELIPERTKRGEAGPDNPYPDKRLALRMRDDGKWVVVLVLQEADEEQGIEEQTIDITQGRGTESSLELRWANPEIDYGNLNAISASRHCTNILGYRLGVDNGLNEGKLLQAVADESSDEPYFNAWKNGRHPTGLCAGYGATAYVYDDDARRVIVDGGVAFGNNAKVTAENAIQIGEGTNEEENTFNFREWQLVNSEGHIPNERIVTDTTLLIEGASADAKAVGDAIKNISLTQKWKCAPETFNGKTITIDFQERNGVIYVTPKADGVAVGNEKPKPEGDAKIIWEPGEDGWIGEDPLVVRLRYVLGQNDINTIQPAGNYLVAEDLQEIEVDVFEAKKITVKDGGVVEMQPFSSINVTKGVGEAKILVQDSDVFHELAFPAKTGTLAIEEDIPEVLPLMTNVTWSELVELKSNNELIPGMQYRVTDYVATTNGNNQSQSANHPFDIILNADDDHTLNEMAHAQQSDEDETHYFDNCNVGAWRVWYCLENDEGRFAWADPNGKGVIYRLIDEYGNDVPYDFKGLKFKAFGDDDQVWRYTFDSGETILSDKWNFVNANKPSEVYEWQGESNGTYTWSYNNGAKVMTFNASRTDKWIMTGQALGNMHSTAEDLNAMSVRLQNARGTVLVKRVEVWSRATTEEPSADLETTDLSILGMANNVFENCIKEYISEGTRNLNQIVFKGDTCHSNSFGSNSREITFGRNCCYNSLGVENYENVFGHTCQSNKFGDYCSSNTFGYNCNSNKWGDTCAMNTFGNGCKYNTCGNECQRLVFGEMCSNNTFGNTCSEIAGGSYISFCKFGSSILKLFFGEMDYESLESGFIFLDIGNMIRFAQVKCSATRTDPSSELCRYISIGDGVSGQDALRMKLVEIPSFNQDHHTTYQLAGEETISI